VPEEDDWLGEIIDQMSDRANCRRDFDAGNSEVRFITFNFDSIIEDRLNRACDSYTKGQAIETAAM
jgi:hypothetical protein